MPAYVFVNVEIIDPARYPSYIQVAPDSIHRYGGRYLARGGRTEKLEGEWEPKRVVVLEFESLERAKEWWASEEYREPKALRNATARTQMIAVEGLASPL
jgi:uncharacterized protein (DUF1330 family)